MLNYGTQALKEGISKIFGSQEKQRQPLGEKEIIRTQEKTAPVDLTSVRSPFWSMMRNANGMMKDNDNAIQYPAIVPPAVSPSRPGPRRRDTYRPPPGPRYPITDPYPMPPSVEEKARASTSMSRKSREGDATDERRFFSTGTPKNATPIALPTGFEPEQRARKPPPTAPQVQQPASQPQVRPRKPGAGGGHQPINTLNRSPFTGSAKPAGARGAARAIAGIGGYTNGAAGLPTSTSRGQNVRQEHDFPEDRETKRQKKDHPGQANGLSSSPRSQSKEIYSVADSDEEVKVRKPLPPVPPKPVKEGAQTQQRPARNRLTSWQPSGFEESRRMDKNKERKGSNADHPHEISDDEGDIAGKSAKERPGGHVAAVQPPLSKRAAEQSVDEMDSTQQKRNKHLSPYFVSKDGKTKRSAKSPPIETGSKQSAFAKDALSILMSGTTARYSNANATKGGPKAQARTISDIVEQNGTAEDGDSGEDDELQADTRPLLPPRKRAPTAKKDAGKKTWTVEKLIDPDGNEYGAFGFLDLDISIGIAGKLVRLRRQDADGSLDNLLVVDPNFIRGIEGSEDSDCRTLRLKCVMPRRRGQLFYDIKFRDREDLLDFVNGLKNTTTLKDMHMNKTKGYMKGIFGKGRYQSAYPDADRAIDEGLEDSLLAKRTTEGTSVERHNLTRTKAAGNRPREHHKLVSQLGIENAANARSGRTLAEQKRIKPVKAQDVESEPPSSSSRPVRTTRQSRRKSPSPQPERLEKYSKEYGLGPPWDQPVVYPEVGRKRVTVDFADLERLDDGEYLNDNLIEFYIRWLQAERPVPDKSVYFFGTHFYSTVSKTSGMSKTARNRNVNYGAVERWTGKEDIFGYDYVVVPINEAHHWYIAIICNLPHVRRKLAGDDADEPSQDGILDEREGTPSRPVVISDSADKKNGEANKPSPEQTAQGSSQVPQQQPAIQQGATTTTDVTPTRGMSKDCEKMSLSSPKPGQAELKGSQATSEGAEGAVVIQDSQSDQQQGSQVSSGVFANAAAPSPEKKRKGKRKSGPGPRKYDTSQPAIVILDSMQISHNKAVATLKEYLIEEGYTKRGMDLNKDMFQGMHAKHGIPQQNNYYDCGIYVCGYLDKLMQGPESFGQKLLAQEFDLQTDWPEMQPRNMRDEVRRILQDIAKTQREKRQAAKAEKRAAKKQASAAPSSPVKEDEKVVYVSSPIKPEAKKTQSSPAEPQADQRRISPPRSFIGAPGASPFKPGNSDPKPALSSGPPTSNIFDRAAPRKAALKSPARASLAPPSPPGTVAVADEDDSEMLFEQNRQVDDSQPSALDNDSDDDVIRQAGGVKPSVEVDPGAQDPGFTIHEDSQARAEVQQEKEEDEWQGVSPQR